MIEDVTTLKKGDKVYYQPFYYHNDEWENGIVKEIPDQSDPYSYVYGTVRVVYNCNDDWDNYENYTGALTNGRDLNLGWKR